MGYIPPPPPPRPNTGDPELDAVLHRRMLADHLQHLRGAAREQRSLFKRGVAIIVALVVAAVIARHARGETITRVIDGDTIVVGREHVRLIGVDAPEIIHPNHPTNDCYGEEAKRQLEIFVGHDVRLFRHGHDLYGRTLAYGYVNRNDPALVAGVAPRLLTNSLNFYMVANGYARSYHKYPHRFSKSYDNAEAIARAGKYGLWGMCP